MCTFDYATPATMDCDGEKVARCASKLAGTGTPAWEADNGLEEPGAPRSTRSLRPGDVDTLRIRSDRNHNGRIAGRANAIVSPASAADRSEEDVLYALYDRECPPGVPQCITRDDGSGPVAMVAVDVSGLTFTYYPRPNFGPCAGRAALNLAFALPLTSQAQADGIGRIRIAVQAPRRTGGRRSARSSPRSCSGTGPSGGPMRATWPDQRGSVLVIAVIAMLVLGILGVSFALLSRLEVATGVNYKSQAQAEALAEAGLEQGRDEVRTGAQEPCGFTQWTDPGNSPPTDVDPGSPSSSSTGPAWTPGRTLRSSTTTAAPSYPRGIQDAACGGGSPPRDTNGVAVVTAWATAANGQGRARVRAVVAVDTPWRHVCASSTQDHPPGHCNEAGHRNGKPDRHRRTRTSIRAARLRTMTCPALCSGARRLRERPRRDHGQLSPWAELRLPVPGREAAGRRG